MERRKAEGKMSQIQEQPMFGVWELWGGEESEMR